MRHKALVTSVAAGILPLVVFFVAHPAMYHSAPANLPAAAQRFDRDVIRVGKAPGFIAIADVNHDGKPDLIAANTADETLSILLGDGKGHFSPAPGSPFSCGKSPNDIAVADMNHDGNPDLVIANTETPLITVLLGDGKGGFKPAARSPFSAASRPHVHGVAVADFNGDGKPDVVTDSWGNNQILMLLGDGAGNLAGPGRAFNTGRRPYQRVRSADFNQDGNPDVVTTNLDDNTVSILLGDGHGGLHDSQGSPFPAGEAPWAAVIDDVNHDGKLDLVILPYEPDVKDPRQTGITVLLGDGKGGFSGGSFSKTGGSPLPLTGCRGPARVATSDFNGDSFRDIAVLCAQNNKLLLYLGSKNGAFSVAMEDIQTGWSGLAVADLNGDGKDDIVVSNGSEDNESKSSPGTITVLLSK